MYPGIELPWTRIWAIRAQGVFDGKQEIRDPAREMSFFLEPRPD
jgi:hypothetical protein